MKKLLFAILVLASCSKDKAPPTPYKPNPAPPPILFSQDKLAGTYNCTLTGTLKMTCTVANPCRTGTRGMNEVFTCTIKKANSGTNMLTADSLLGNEVPLTMLSDSTFKCNYFIYDPHGCAVPLATTWSYGTIKKDTITLINSGYYSDSYSSIQSDFTCIMVKQ